MLFGYDTIVGRKKPGEFALGQFPEKIKRKKEKVMKSTIAVILAILMTFYSVPLMGAETEPLEKGMFFPSLEACKMAFESGEFRFYQPDPKHLKTPPASAKGLPRAGCAREDVREHKGGSPAWVILASDTPSVFNPDGVPVVDGRCHNKIHDFVWLPLLRGLPGPVGPMGLQGPQGSVGRDGRDGRDYVPLPVGKDTTNRRPKTWPWVVGGILLAGGVVALASGGGKKSGTPPGGNTGPAF